MNMMPVGEGGDGVIEECRLLPYPLGVWFRGENRDSESGLAMAVSRRRSFVGSIGLETRLWEHMGSCVVLLWCLLLLIVELSGHNVRLCRDPKMVHSSQLAKSCHSLADSFRHTRVECTSMQWVSCLSRWHGIDFHFGQGVTFGLCL